MTRTITVTQTEPRVVAMIASEVDEPLERHLRRACNALGGLAYNKYELNKPVIVGHLSLHGWAEVRPGVTAVLTEHIEGIDEDPYRAFVQSVAGLDDGPDTDTCERLQELILWAQDIVKKGA